MKTRIPNLFLKCDGEQDYHHYLSRMMLDGSPERIIQVCRRIRAYAAQGPGVEAGLFTYFYEIDALCKTGKYAVAWRQLLQRDRTLRGAGFDYKSSSWSRKDCHDLLFRYGPLLYLTGHSLEAAAILEKALEFKCHGTNGSYDAMYKVANEDPEPTNHYRVTLLHCYRRLGRPLSDWTGWRSFVMGMNPRLFRMAKIARESMLVAPGLLVDFQTRLRQILAERTQGSGGTCGICDLLDSPSKVKKRHAATVRGFKQFQESIRTEKNQKERDLAKAFVDYEPLPETEPRPT
jgi:hypothetical protein